MWDSHAQNSDRLQDVLCPQFDVGFTALIEDLDVRGLLAETLVVVIGEFGRTPRINKQGGRDHWGHVFSFALAGAGIRTAQVYGSSDAQGAWPCAPTKVEPQELTATIFHTCSASVTTPSFPDQTDRPHRVTEGQPLRTLLGNSPATRLRATATGSPALVPLFSDALLLNTQFQDDAPLARVGSGGRLRGWQAEPIAAGPEFGAQIATDAAGERFLRLGFDDGAGAVAPPARALVSQEVRNPRAGRYTLSIRTRTAGTPEAWSALLDAFSFRLMIFGYQNTKKDPRQVREFASLAFRPTGDGAPLSVSLAAALKSQDDGAFQLSQGVGVALIVERRRPVPQALEPVAGAHLRVDSIELTFDPRPRNDDVTV